MFIFHPVVCSWGMRRRAGGTKRYAASVHGFTTIRYTASFKDSVNCSPINSTLKVSTPSVSSSERSRKPLICCPSDGFAPSNELRQTDRIVKTVVLTILEYRPRNLNHKPGTSINIILHMLLKDFRHHKLPSILLMKVANSYCVLYILLI